MIDPASILSTTWTRVVVQFFVVFGGVYGAFWVEGYRDDLERAERTQEVILALGQDLQDFVEVSHQFNTQMRTGLDDWNNARTRGETPPPFVFRIFGAEVPPLTTWDVVSQSELASLLDPALLYELGFFYNESQGYGKRYVRYAANTEEKILPVREMQPVEQVRAFYKKDMSGLKPEFAANMRRLSELHAMSSALTEWATCLKQALAVPDPRAPNCRYDMGVVQMFMDRDSSL